MLKVFMKSWKEAWNSSKVWIIFSHRFSIKRRTYPAILPAKGDKVTGKVSAYKTWRNLYISFVCAQNWSCSSSMFCTYLWFIVLQVLFGLTDKELEVLDDFEDTEYTRQVVEPILLVLATCTFYSSWISYYNISPPI